MRIGLINELHGRPDGAHHPTWASIRERALTARGVGFDVFVFEDALMYREEDATDGVWESMTVAGALCAVTESIEIAQSVVNSVYRSPAMVASMAETLSEISNGRYVLGIGAGNTPDSDYEGFGFPTDHRYSRFAEAIEIIHTLLKTGSVDFKGRYYTAKNAELVLRGPGEQGPPINIAGGGDRMLGLVARYADAWNWWSWDEDFDGAEERLKPIISKLESELSVQGRAPDELDRTLDYYTIVPEGFSDQVPRIQNPLRGTSEQIAEELVRFRALGFSEIRCDVFPKTAAAIEAMEPVVALVHAS